MTKTNVQFIAEVEQALIEIDEVDSLEIYPEKQVISWLRALLEENKRLDKEIRKSNHRGSIAKDGYDHIYKLWEQSKVELQQTKEELKLSSQAHEHAERDLNRTHTQLEQVKAERDELKEENGDLKDAMERQLDYELHSLRTELSAKDKVLELYAHEDMYTVLHLGCSPMVMAERGGQARSILSQYKGESHE